MPTVVIVCGWLGGKSRVVAKYAALYQESLGLDTFTLLSAPSDYVKLERRHHVASFKTFRKRLANHHDKRSRLVIIPHVMSNGGCYSWNCFQSHLDRAGISFDMPCTIFDSCLSLPRDVRSIAIAFSILFTKNDILRSIVAAVCLFVLSVASFLVTDIFGIVGPVQSNYNRVILRDAAIPKLFLYSKADRIVESKHIELAIAKANELKTPVVQGVDFGTSDHVAHFTYAPERYKQSVRGFVSQFVKLQPRQ